MGHFTITVQPGTFRVWATRGSQASTRARIEVGPAQQPRVTLSLVESSIAGTVVDSDGHPIAKATVDAHPSDDRLDAGTVVASDEHGHFEVAGIPPGDYQLIAQQPGATVNAKLGKGQTLKTGEHAAVITVPVLATIKGRVLLEHRPVAAYRIIVADRGNEMQWRQTFGQVYEGADGRFEQSRVSAGPRTLVIFGPGFARKLVDIDVQAATVNDLGDIEVDHGQVLHGHVVDSHGAPVAGATVRVEQEAPVRITNADPYWWALMGNAISKTDASGNYEVRDIPPGTTFGRPSGAGPWENRIGAEHYTRGIAPLRDFGPADTTADLVLLETGGIVGKLVGAERDHENVWAQRADHTGDFGHSGIERDRSFHFDRLPVGAYELRITRQNWDGYVPPPTLVTVSAGKVAHATITVPESVTLRGHVRDGKCQVVLLVDPKSKYAPTDARSQLGHSFCEEDHVDITNVPPGNYSVCTDELHCTPVTAAASPSTQTFDLRP